GRLRRTNAALALLASQQDRGRPAGPRPRERDHRDRQRREAQMRRRKTEARTKRRQSADLDPALGSAVMRLSDLRDAKVKSLDGETPGRVHEVHSEGGRLVELTCGAGSWLESLTAKTGGRRVPWAWVVGLERKR